ncbi:MAG: DUF4358 domain-containing protein [Oscillospiraceae bacterium]
MKRICCIVTAAAVLLFLLTACGGEQSERKDPVGQSSQPVQSEQPEANTPPEDAVQQHLALEDVYQAILDAQTGNGQEELVLFPESNPDALNSYYPGLADIELAQQLYYTPPVYGHACEILLVEVARKDDVQAVKDIFQARIDQAASDTAYPENAEPWARNAQVQADGCYVCMIVLPDGFTIPENVFDIG